MFGVAAEVKTSFHYRKIVVGWMQGDSEKRFYIGGYGLQNGIANNHSSNADKKRRAIKKLYEQKEVNGRKGKGMSVNENTS